jgi:hypothetical protein
LRAKKAERFGFYKISDISNSRRPLTEAFVCERTDIHDVSAASVD